MKLITSAMTTIAVDLDRIDRDGSSVRKRIDGSHKFCPVSRWTKSTTAWRK